eukprot:TRINITY_DN36066_c0_g1_i1.p2 TRINITY_DN36066_c0_g1~~TRINITY_DN36066_c0_g1_i1.p2  ORF type:complete len:192 (-),score=26.09 TRINITY_DN36066_c0_g1_i1:412-987(-)
MPLTCNAATASGTMIVNGRLVGDRCNGEPGASWFSWDRYTTKGSASPYVNTLEAPSDISESRATLYSRNKHNERLLVEVDLKLGLQARSLTIRRPTLVHAFIDLGAAYETALGAGVTSAFVIWLICRGRIKAAGEALGKLIWKEEASETPTPTSEPGDKESPEEHMRKSEDEAPGSNTNFDVPAKDSAGTV